MIFLKNNFAKKIFQLPLKSAVLTTFNIHRELLSSIAAVLGQPETQVNLVTIEEQLSGNESQ